MWGCSILLGMLVFIYVLGARYQDRHLSKLDVKKCSLHFLYPSIGFWLQRLGFFQSESAKRRIEVIIKPRQRCKGSLLSRVIP